ncbi:hypothetical protein [Desulfatiglans anilini]|uniref:hypothetical protein n=1 Tax=Desulfatiglans anilini TaxID=90728 RepID=UPI0004862233|nr:hypothetical protein [Desulfatiglans anilini]
MSRKQRVTPWNWNMLERVVTMNETAKARAREGETQDDAAKRREIERTNARLRHFRGVAASVLAEAIGLWKEIWLALEDPRSCMEILDDAEGSESLRLVGERVELLEKLHVLGVKIDYAKRLCEGDIGREKDGREAERWKNS